MSIERPQKEGFNPSLLNSSTAAPSSRPAVELPPLTAETMGMYWTARWDQNATNWKIAERKEGDALFIKNLAGLLHISEEQTKTKKDFLTSFFDPRYKGIEVFVPLCGDSGILAFLFQCGFSVSGADAAEVALRNVMKEASSNLPPGFEVVWEEKIVQQDEEKDSHKIFTGILHNKTAEASSTSSLGNKITLICGNFFTAPFPENFRADIIYDRAAFIAVPPSTRDLYAKKMRSLFHSKKQQQPRENKINLFQNICKKAGEKEEVGTAYFFSLMQRGSESKAKGQGPPFFFPVEEFKKYYDSSDNCLIDVVHFPTEEEAGKIPGNFLEGIAHLYTFV
jgi:hypothetical protein